MSALGAIISSMIYSIGMITNKFPINDDRWFSRLAFGCICLGLLGIILSIDKSQKLTIDKSHKL